VAFTLHYKYVMRSFIKIVENANMITVYHGDAKENVTFHPGMFFSTSKRFCESYGPHITEWKLNQTDLIDSLDSDMIEDLLPLYDPYTDTDLNDISDYMDRSSDTWEIIENHAEGLCSLYGAAGMVVYEGGVKNFVIYHPRAITPA
jgi:hypothetical protein